MSGENCRTAGAGNEFPLWVPAVFANEEGFLRKTRLSHGRVLHASGYLIVALCEEGAGTGTLYTETDCGTFRDSALCLIPPHCFYHLERSGGDWRFMYMDAEDIVLHIYQGQQDTYSDLLQKLRPQVYPADHIHCRNIYNLTKLIEMELEQKRDLYQESICCMCSMLLVSIARRSQGENVTVLGRYQQNALNEQLRPALQYIEERYAQPLKVSEMAAASHLSESHFRRLFEQYMNRTPGDYLNLVRISNACDYLLENKYTVEEVAVRVGYGSISTFYRNFNRFVGKSPFKWKKEKKIL